MSRQEGKEISIDQQISDARKALEAYDINVDIHNFNISEDYRRKFQEAGELKFDVCKKLGIKKKKIIKRK